MVLNHNFINPPTPVYNKGAIVIESDDGLLGDYTHWSPLFIKKKRQHSFWNENTVPFCPAINSATIGDSGRLRIPHLEKMKAWGWELMSHGQFHSSLATHTVVAQVNSGQNRIDMKAAGTVQIPGNYEYEITDGVNSESFFVIEKNGSTSYLSDGHILIDRNLVNGYEVNSIVRLTENGMNALLQGCIDDMAEWGIECKHHVFTYHFGSQHLFNQEAVNKVSAIFESARGVSEDYNDGNTNIHLLKSRLLNDTLSLATIDTILDNVATNDYVTIFYGHGETNTIRMEQLEHIVDGAISRGIRILTRSDAVAYLNSK